MHNRYTTLFLLLFITLAPGACRIKQAKVNNDLKKYFDEYQTDGCFTMLNNSTGEVMVYNMGMDTTRVLPASTFKIVNSLIGLQTGRILNDTMMIRWDGVKRRVEDWNKDMGMKEAFRVSNVAYYQEVARRIGADTMKKWIDSIGYGNRDISGPVDSFWLNNRLKVSPDEQLGLLKRLYFDQLPFRKSVQASVKEAMLREDSAAYRLSYKTGWGFDESNNSIGWLVGWIEENRHVYFFVTLLKSPNRDFDMMPARIGITKNILRALGFMVGRK